MNISGSDDKERKKKIIAINKNHSSREKQYIENNIGTYAPKCN